MPDPKQPDPPPQGPILIPVQSITFPAGVKVSVPGRRGVVNGLNATKPSLGEYWSIAFDPKLRHHVVAYFKPGKDAKRPPDEVLMLPEGMVTWKRAA